MTYTSGILRSLAKGVGIISGELQQKQPELFSLYAISLQSLWLGLKKTDAEIKADPVLTRIAGLMTACEKPGNDQDTNWRNAWQAEQLMSDYLDNAKLIAEAEKKLFDAEKSGLPSAAHFAKKWKEASDIADPGQKAKMETALYHGILEDMQWHYGKRLVGRKVFHALGDSALRLTTILFCLILLPFLPISDSKTFGEMIFLGDTNFQFSHIYGLYTACSFGLLGAMFSRLITFKSNFENLDIDQLINIWSRNPLYIRLLLGMIGSIVVFYAIFGNFLGGELFPDVSTMKFNPAERPSMDFAKLVIWCFLGGFSERLVPDFLTRTETSAAKSS